MSEQHKSLAAELNACGRFYYASSHCTKARVRDGRLQVWDDLNEGWLLVTDTGALRKADGRGFSAHHGPHTPLPWRFASNGGQLNRAQVFGPAHPVDGGNYAALATLANPADAELIVRAVNCHADLVDALRDARGYVEAYGNSCSERGFYQIAANARATFEAINAALAKALPTNTNPRTQPTPAAGGGAR